MVKRNRHRFFVEYLDTRGSGLRTTRVFAQANLAYEFINNLPALKMESICVVLETKFPNGNRTYKPISLMSLLEYTGSGNKPRALYKGGK